MDSDLRRLFASIEDESLASRIKEYCTRTGRLDRLLRQLTRAYCAMCPRNADYGCCDFAEEATRNLPPEFIALQEVEAACRQGVPSGIEGVCCYHTRSGCKLRYMKSPSCLGQICGRLEKDVLERYGTVAQPFLDAMQALCRGSLTDSESNVLFCLDRAIHQARKLLERCSEDPELAPRDT